MTDEKRQRFTIIENAGYKTTPKEEVVETNFHTNPMYEKLLQFNNLQEKQKKRFSVEDLFKLC